MRIAMISPVAWRTPPRHYGPWENVVSLLTEGLVKKGIGVTLFATRDSRTRGRLAGICPRGYEEDKSILPKVWECLHISEVFEQADRFDIIHNHFDFLPLTYSALVRTPVLTTIHGFSSPKILPVYQKYDQKTFYVSISDADRCKDLHYISTIHHGIALQQFTFRPSPGRYLLFFGRIHPEKGTKECIQAALQAGMPLQIAGIVQDASYYESEVRPAIDDRQVRYLGPVGPKKRDRLLGEAYALLHPISFEEPFGLSVVESMACGTPVIAFDRGSMREVIHHGQTGFLVQNTRQMAETVSKIATLNRLDCRRWVEKHFSAERMVEDYIAVYEKILRISRP